MTGPIANASEQRQTVTHPRFLVTSPAFHGGLRSAVVRLFCFFLVSNSSTVALPDFESEVAPLLIRRCVECHQGEHPSGGLLLTTRKGLNAGGDSGSVVDLRNTESSHLLQRIVDGEMPPPKQGRSQKLSDVEAAIVRKWLDAGANWPEGRVLDYFERTNDVRAGRDWWSLQPVVRPEVPRRNFEIRPENPIDAFVRAKLDEERISPAPKADRRTLIRRAYFDLIGLPPSIAEMESFVRNNDPDAWPQLIDRLLDRPQYGERWGRYWLDLARYADTSGYERDQEKPFAWKYRDWVVSAFNTDMPYDRFIIEQLAGDEVPNRNEQSVIATGFLRLGTWNDEPNDRLDYQYERLEDLVHTTSSAFLALTVKCARCHSHKFDAITQEDYYRMAAAFWPGPLLASGKQLGGPTEEELGFKEVLGWTDRGPFPKPLHLLRDGERRNPLNEVIPASISTIPTLERRFDSPPDGAVTTHRRLQLARWISAPGNPLTSRVLVNRLWQHHFGKAIVRTPNNFGFLSAPPTHPKLLDWLAAEFQSHGRRMKPIHRIIMTSETWQQSTLHPNAKQLVERDSGNQLWWRAERRRLDAETLRDSLLEASGELDHTVGGPGFKPTYSPDAIEGLSRKNKAWTASEPDQQKRRSIYMYLKRGLLPPFMTRFDLCDPTQSCGKRDVSIVPTQALALLNNQFVHDRSLHLAALTTTQQQTLNEQIQATWSRVLNRFPSDGELNLSRHHIETQLETFSETPFKNSPPADEASLLQRINASLSLQLRADTATVAVGSSRVESLRDLSEKSNHAAQLDVTAQPMLDPVGFGGKPVIRFDGNGQFLNLKGQLLSGQLCTIICVINDDNGSGHREIISNWNGAAGNSTSSMFLGLTSENTVRFSDALSIADKVTNRTKPFVLSAVNSSETAAVFQNGRLLKRSSALPMRRVDTPWVIGQQGNIDGEFWKGGIAEIRVYNRDLSDVERRLVEKRLAARYGIEVSSLQSDTKPDRLTLALASLGHVLMNSNEFLFID